MMIKLLKFLALVVLLAQHGKAQAQFMLATNNGAITVTRYTGTGGAVVVPSETNGLPVTSIDMYAFLNCFNVTSVVIPGGVTNIGFGAFDYCTALTSITMPDSITSIGEQAFTQCWSLTNVTIPSGVKNIEVGTFFFCGNLTTVDIPISVTNIGEGAFYACANLAGITIPDGVQRIGYNAFYLCTSITNVAIPNSVTKIEGNSFFACSSLEAFIVNPLNPSYTSKDGVLFSKDLSRLVACPGGRSGSYAVPEGVRQIGEFAFAVCRSLTNIYLPGTVTNIGLWSFSQCENIRRITIPKSIAYIGERAFQLCTSLREAYFQGNTPTVGPSAFSSVNLKLYYLPGTTGWNEFFLSLNTFGTLWNPQAQLNNGQFGIQTNSFGFNIMGTMDIPIVIEAATDLNNSAWIALQSGVLTNGLIYFSDAQWTNFPKRFYRIRSP